MLLAKGKRSSRLISSAVARSGLTGMSMPISRCRSVRLSLYSGSRMRAMEYLVPSFFGHQAAKHVGFVAGGGGNDDIRLVRPRVHPQSGGVGPICRARTAHPAYPSLRWRTSSLRSTMTTSCPSLCEMFRQRMTYFAVTNHQDSHTSILRIHKAVQIIKGISIAVYHYSISWGKMKCLRPLLSTPPCF